MPFAQSRQISNNLCNCANSTRADKKCNEALHTHVQVVTLRQRQSPLRSSTLTLFTTASIGVAGAEVELYMVYGQWKALAKRHLPLFLQSTVLRKCLPRFTVRKRNETIVHLTKTLSEEQQTNVSSTHIRIVRMQVHSNYILFNDTTPFAVLKCVLFTSSNSHDFSLTDST